LPEVDVLEMLRQHSTASQSVPETDEIKELKKTLTVETLDLMYFWFYLPRARDVLTLIVERMSADEKETFASCQLLLTRVKQNSQMMVDGLVGQNFARALEFYLSKYNPYLKDISELTGQPIYQTEENHHSLLR
jgi:hypothetical protein